MSAYNRLRLLVGDQLRHRPRLKAALASLENRTLQARATLDSYLPALHRPRGYKIMIAVTARCNARCIGCRYGRDFMVGHQLTYEMVRGVLEDAALAGFYSIRLYGGEPTLHPDLPRMIEACVQLGLRPYVTTNAVNLASKVDALFEAGLRDLSVGFYGVGQEYDEYVQTPGLFARVERGIATARRRYGNQLDIQMNWLLMRKRANARSLRAAWDFANRYHMPMRVDLVHYSLPYFQEGPDRQIQFRAEDRPMIEGVVEQLLRYKEERPEMINHDPQGLRSIPDWLILGADMRVPCTASEMIWIGADGSVQMCYVTFPMGNLHDQPLRDMLDTEVHRKAARQSVRLDCPNCHCSSNERVMRHRPSYKRYSVDGRAGSSNGGA